MKLGPMALNRNLSKEEKRREATMAVRNKGIQVGDRFKFALTSTHGKCVTANDTGFGQYGGIICEKARVYCERCGETTANISSLEAISPQFAYCDTFRPPMWTKKVRGGIMKTATGITKKFKKAPVTQMVPPINQPRFLPVMGTSISGNPQSNIGRDKSDKQTDSRGARTASKQAQARKKAPISKRASMEDTNKRASRMSTSQGIMDPDEFADMINTGGTDLSKLKYADAVEKVGAMYGELIIAFKDMIVEAPGDVMSAYARYIEGSNAELLKRLRQC